MAPLFFVHLVLRMGVVRRVIAGRRPGARARKVVDALVFDTEVLFVEIRVFHLTRSGTGLFLLKTAPQGRVLLGAAGVVTPSALGEAGTRMFGVHQRRTDGLHFSRRFGHAPRFRFGGHRAVHAVGVRVVDSTHPPGLGHLLSPLSGEEETTPTRPSDEHNAADDRESNGQRQSPSMQSSVRWCFRRRRRRTCYQCFIEDGGGIREEGLSGYWGLTTGNMQSLQDWLMLGYIVGSTKNKHGRSVQFARYSCCGMKL